MRKGNPFFLSLPFLLLTTPLLGVDLETRLKWLLFEPLPGLNKFVSDLPPTLATVKLGKLLFYDKRLSKDRTVSCASCHQSEFAFSNQTALSKGVGGLIGKRKSPVIFNRAFHGRQFWDGSAESLEAQVIGPLTNPLEMGMTTDGILEVMKAIPGYRTHFEASFGSSEITIEKISKAIADFERTLLSGNSKFDRWQKDPLSVSLSPLEDRGVQLFNDRECHICHKAPAFTDDLFHNTGVAFRDGKFLDEGRFGHTKLSGHAEDRELGAFKTPTLRNLKQHGPYMHDGSIATLEAVINFYDDGGRDNPQLSEEIIPLGLKPEDKAALLAFLGTLEGEGFEDEAPDPAEFPR